MEDEDVELVDKLLGMMRASSGFSFGAMFCLVVLPESCEVDLLKEGGVQGLNADVDERGKSSSGSAVYGAAFLSEVEPEECKKCTSNGETMTSSSLCLPLPVPIDNLDDFVRRGRPADG